MAHTVHTGLVPPAGGGAACCYGGFSVGETPGPIPNPEAKPHSADGTAPGRVWESRTPPHTRFPGPGPPPPGVARGPTPLTHLSSNLLSLGCLFCCWGVPLLL